MSNVRLRELYETSIRPQLKKELGLGNIMEVPKLKKIVVNVGVKEAVADSRALQHVSDALAKITGQIPVRTIAKKSIAGFKIREDMPLGVKVTLRGAMMYDFLDKLINLALPQVRDFQGISDRFDRDGNYNLGIKEWVIFPELDQRFSEKVHGMNITFHIAVKEREHSLPLLKSFSMPFKSIKK